MPDGNETRVSSASLTLPDRPRSPVAELLVLAGPMIGLTISRMAINLVDVYMVSMLGTAAQAAISPSTILLFAISCIGMGMAQSIQTFVSQAVGRGEPGRCGAYAWQAIYIGMLTGLVTLPLTLTTPIWMGAIAAFGEHPANVRAMEITFLSISLWSIAPATICAGLDSFYNGIRRPRMGFIAIIASLITVFLANYALIWGHWGFPALGIKGSAIATVLSWTVRMIVLIIPLFSASIDRVYHTRHAAKLAFGPLGDIMRLGWPISMQWFVDIGAWVVFQQFMIPPFGEVQMAAVTIAIQYMHLSFMPALGIGMALTTQVGNAIGAGRPGEAVMRVRIARRLVIAYMVVMGVLFVVAGRPFAWLWTENEAVVSATAVALLWCATFQFFDALCITYSFALRGTGDTRGPALLFFWCCWGIFVAGGYGLVKLAPQLGTHGPWSMCSLYIIVLGVLLLRRFHTEKWRDIRIFEKERGMPVALDEPRAEPRLQPAGTTD
jgi:MATE family multidrug resistance protein